MRLVTRALLLVPVCLLLAPAARSAEDALPGDGLSGRDIYQRVIDNKLDTSYIEHRIVSTDPGGSEQKLAFWSRFKDLREPGAAPDGAEGAAMLKESSPQGTLAGKRVTVIGPFAPGTTLVQFAYSMSYSGATLTVEQRLPVAMTQLTMLAQKVGV